MSSFRLLSHSLALLLLAGCGGSKLEAKTGAQVLAERDQMDASGGVMSAPMESVSSPITFLERQDVVKTVDAGLGYFLQQVETEPSLSPSRDFIGFRIVRVSDPKTFEGLGIGPGDIVTSINDHPIERPMEAYEAFVALKTAPSLEIDYLRGGRMMRLSLPIVGEPEDPAQDKPKSKPPQEQKKDAKAKAPSAP